MREIKFRYKVKNSNKLIYDSNPKFGGINTARKAMSYGDGGILFIEEEMQFTNHKDKNGKEIYEGDIVSYKQKNYCNLGICESIGIVRYNVNNYDSGFAIDSFKVGKVIGEYSTYEMDFYDYMGISFCWDDLEVIGNIYENIELTKVIE